MRHHDFVPAATLVTGDKLEGQDGPTTIVRIEHESDDQQVYNLEIHGEHVFRVTNQQFLVHNDCNEDLLFRMGTSRESANRLGKKSAEAEKVIGVHGVSVSGTKPNVPSSQAPRGKVEEHFTVHDTPTRGDPNHKTVELPKPVTEGVASIFNKIFLASAQRWWVVVTISWKRVNTTDWVIRQSIVFAWLDGPIHGICAMVNPPAEFEFRCVSTRTNPEGLDYHLYSIGNLPTGTVKQAITLLSHPGSPKDTVWVPLWSTSSIAEREAMENQLDALLNHRVETDLYVYSQDLRSILGAWTVASPPDNLDQLFDILEVQM